jgi:hypothetical protein
MKLPSHIQWVTIEDVSPLGYRECLVMEHKHSNDDWMISPACVVPLDGYTDFKIMRKTRIATSYEQEVKKSDVMAIGFYKTYGYVSELGE